MDDASERLAVGFEECSKVFVTVAGMKEEREVVLRSEFELRREVPARATRRMSLASLAASACAVGSETHAPELSFFRCEE